MPRHPPCALTHLTTTRCSHPLCNTQHTTTPRTPHPPPHQKPQCVRPAKPRMATKKTPHEAGVSSGPNSVPSPPPPHGEKPSEQAAICVPPSHTHTPTPTGTGLLDQVRNS